MKYLTRLLALCMVTWLDSSFAGFSLQSGAQTTFPEDSGTIKLTFEVLDSDLVTPSSPWQVMVTTNHITTDGNDLLVLAAQTFIGATASGRTATVDVLISIQDDQIYEGPGGEMFNVQVRGGGGTKLFGQPPFEVNITITDDDIPPVRLQLPKEGFISESAGRYNFSVLFADHLPKSEDISVYVTTSNYPGIHEDARSGEDYMGLNNEAATIMMGKTSVMISFEIIDDADAEEVECLEVFVNGSNVEGNFTFNVCIIDDDGWMKYHTEEDHRWDLIILNNTTGNSTVDTCSSGPNVTHSAECDHDNLYVCVKPFGNFTGVIHIKDKPECILSSSKTRDCDGYNHVFPLFPATDSTNTCTTTTINELDGSISKRVHLKIVYNELAMQKEDVIVTCTFPAPGNYSIAHVNTKFEDTTGGPVTTKPPFEINIPQAPGITSLTDENLNPVPKLSAVTEGTVLIFCFQVNANVYSGFNFDYVEINNAQLRTSAARFDNRVLILNGCAQGYPLEKSPYEENGPHRKCFNFYVMKLLYTDLLDVFGVVSLYRSTVPAACGGSGRRKRQTEDEGAVKGTVKYEVQVEENGPTDVLDAAEKCKRSWMSAAVGLGLVCATMIIIIILLAANVISYNGNGKPKHA